MLRVLHVVSRTARGGLETMLMNYYRNIDRSQIQFDFLKHRMHKEDYDDEILRLGGKVYTLPRMNPWNPQYLSSLDNFFAQHPEYKIVHVHQDCMSSVVLKAAKNNGVPIRIAHSHSSSQDKNIKYPIKLLYRSKITKYATDLLACSQEAGEWMFRGATFKIFNNAIDANKFQYSKYVCNKIREQYRIPKDTFVVGHIGRFHSVKNHSFLIDVFKEINARNNNSVLFLIGDGKLRKRIETKVKKLNLQDNVIFSGICDNVHELLNAFDVFVMPSLYEGFPVSLMEAQANGLPCVICDHFSTSCDITRAVHRIPLKNNPSEWANVALKFQNTTRINFQNVIELSELNIARNTELLKEYYIERVESICL